MAKKRTKRSARRAVRRPARRSVRRTVSQPSSNVKAYRIADMLVSIAIAFTLINAVLVILFPGSAVNASSQLNVITTAASWQYLGVAWIFLAFFAYITNRITRVSMKGHTMWGLLIIGIVLGAISMGQPVMLSAVLMIISALTYILKSRK